MGNKRAVVLGAGIVGMLTAEALWHEGFEVIVVDQHSHPAFDTSFANAGQLCAPFCLPFAAPGFLPSFLKKSVSSSGVGFSLGTVLRNTSWLFQFFRNCSWESYKRNSVSMLKFAFESIDTFETVRNRHDIEFNYRPNCGKLYLYDTVTALHSRNQLLDIRNQIGLNVEILTAKQCMDREPLLNNSSIKFAGGIYSPDSSVGDCAAFTQQLAKSLEKKGVQFHFLTKATGLVIKNEKLVGIDTSKGFIHAPMAVLSTATGTAQLLPKSMRSAFLVAPLKGYSITLPLTGEGPKGTITDSSRAVAFSVLGDSLRLTGGAFLSDSKKLEAKEIERLLKLGKAWFPDAAVYNVDPATGWSGLRPVTPSSMPYIGKTHIGGLLMNTGHGAFGWTFGAQSARRLVKALDNV